MPNSTTQQVIMQLVQAAAEGDQQAWEKLDTTFRPQLKRMVRVRLDPRLASRVDASDVVQEALFDAAIGLREFISKPQMPFFLWLRLMTGSRLAKIHRFHLGTQRRSIARECGRDHVSGPDASSILLAERFIADQSAPEQRLARTELRERLISALDELPPLEREVLVLRHFEQLTNADAAVVVGLTPGGTSKCYFRGLQRLKEVFGPEASSGSALQ